jgi:formylmethanofuran dehydrogenase subunit E
MQTLENVLTESAKHHKQLCPRQVLGARMGIFATNLLGIDRPCTDKRLIIISETDGCFVDGLIAATGCHLGSRTLRFLDFGKVAATFVDTYSEETIRIVPKREAGIIATEYAPHAKNKWEAMLLGYQVMPAPDLFVVQRIQLNNSLEQIIGRPGMKAICEICGEEIMNRREVLNNGLILCRACAGESYYHCFSNFLTAELFDHVEKP